MASRPPGPAISPRTTRRDRAARKVSRRAGSRPGVAQRAGAGGTACALSFAGDRVRGVIHEREAPGQARGVNFHSSARPPSARKKPAHSSHHGLMRRAIGPITTSTLALPRRHSSTRAESASRSSSSSVRSFAPSVTKACPAAGRARSRSSARVRGDAERLAFQRRFADRPAVAVHALERDAAAASRARR